MTATSQLIAVHLKSEHLNIAQIDKISNGVAKLCQIWFYKDIRKHFPEITELKQKRPTYENSYRFLTLTVPKEYPSTELTKIKSIKLSRPTIPELETLQVEVKVLSDDDLEHEKRNYPVVGKIFVKNWRTSMNESIRDYINEELGTPQIIKVERFKKREKEGTLKDTALLKLIFNKSIVDKVPSTLTVAGRTYAVNPYVLQPRGCNKCLQYGHMANACLQRSYTCKKCGGIAEKNVDASMQAKKLIFGNHKCQDPIVCVNCAKIGLPMTNHSPFADICPIKRKELKIRTLAASENMRMCDARKRYRENSDEAFVIPTLETELCENLTNDVVQNEIQKEKAKKRLLQLQHDVRVKQRQYEEIKALEAEYNEKYKSYIKRMDDLQKKFKEINKNYNPEMGKMHADEFNKRYNASINNKNPTTNKNNTETNKEVINVSDNEDDIPSISSISSYDKMSTSDYEPNKEDKNNIPSNKLHKNQEIMPPPNLNLKQTTPKEKPKATSTTKAPKRQIPFEERDNNNKVQKKDDKKNVSTYLLNT